MVKENNMQLSKYPSIHYKKFFDRFSDIDTLDIKQWQVAHLLGYFCKRYKDHYGIDFSFRFNGPPSKCYEVFQINKLAGMLSSDPQILKDYIDWIYDQKIIQRQKRLTSLGYLTTVDLVNEYKFKYLITNNNLPINRSTVLSEEIIKIAQEKNIEINTYGDLAFIKLSSKDNENYKQLLRAIETRGVNLTILDRIK